MEVRKKQMIQTYNLHIDVAIKINGDKHVSICTSGMNMMMIIIIIVIIRVF